MEDSIYHRTRAILVMSYGLTNTTAVFQSFMNEVFQDIINRFLVVYIDDILIYSHSLKEQIQHVQKLLQWLIEHNLYVKTEKSTFHVTSVNFLGFILTPGGISIDENKVTTVSNWPKPTTVNNLLKLGGTIFMFGKITFLK